MAEVRHAFSKYNGSMGTSGSLAYMFNSMGVIEMPEGSDEDAVMEVALEAGADDIVTHEDGTIEVTCSPSDYVAVMDAFKDAGMEVATSEVTKRAENQISLSVEDSEKVMKLIDALEDLDDVVDVFSNADFPEEAFAE